MLYQEASPTPYCRIMPLWEMQMSSILTIAYISLYNAPNVHKQMEVLVVTSISFRKVMSCSILVLEMRGRVLPQGKLWQENGENA